MPAPISRCLADSQSLHELRPSGGSDLFSLLSLLSLLAKPQLMSILARRVLRWCCMNPQWFWGYGSRSQTPFWLCQWLGKSSLGKIPLVCLVSPQLVLWLEMRSSLSRTPAAG